MMFSMFNDDLRRGMRYYYKQIVMLFVDSVLLLIAGMCALWARLGMVWIPSSMAEFTVYGLTIIVSLFFFMRLGLYRSIIRYMGLQAFYAILHGVTVSALTLALVAFLSNSFMPRSVPVIYWCFAFILIGGSRFAIRAYYQNEIEIYKERVLIYGAGTSGLQVYKALSQGKEYKPVAFLDDNAAKQGMIIDGLPVFSAHNVVGAMQATSATKVLLAMPSVTKQRRREIVHSLESLGVSVHVMPGLEDLLESTFRGDGVAHVYENILGRPPVQPHEALLSSCISDKVVLVTGAGGSIGSELCRQILTNRPRQLILFDSSEYALYNIERELRDTLTLENISGIDVVALLGSVRDEILINRILKTFQVQTIYHAAAYKHLPMVEGNVIEGVQNNIFGTAVMSRAATLYSVEAFVLVSTDKAVRSSSIMGATKRCAEMICNAYASLGKTKFCMVRFGNVLGSSGSVMPLFFEQINSGGPVTVTHMEMTRYFMTIREAAQLVLQAGSMGSAGEVFVLNMGEPVRIIDLANRMIALMGYDVRDADNPDGDIEIKITGMRAGEKLHETLVLGDNISGTVHPMIMRADEGSTSLVGVQSFLEMMQRHCDAGDCRAIGNLLLSFVPDYKPVDRMGDILLKYTRDVAVPAVVSNVTPLIRSKGD